MTRFYLSTSQDCSYLPGQTSQSLMLDPEQPATSQLHSLLSRHGFRRSGSLVYRPHCPSCQACVAVRIPVEQFLPSRSQARVLKRGNQLEVTECAPSTSNEHYQLFARYIEQRHSDGSMYPPSPEQYSDFLCQPLDYAHFFEFRLEGKLLAVAVSDLLDDGLSAVYTFFDPQAARWSLGQLAVLWQIAEAKRRQLPYLYLGYWIRDCQKMSYKTDYQPLEGWIDEHWQPLAPS